MTTCLCLAAALCTTPAIECPPTARYYFLLFAGESVPFQPRSAHTWATVVKTTPAANGLLVEPITISWLPTDGDVKPFRLRPVPGRNWGLDETIVAKLATPGRVVLWGPFETDANRYDRLVSRAAELASGAIRYQVIYAPCIQKDVSHCVHAITQADPVLFRRDLPVVRVGEPGTHHLAKVYARTGAFIHPEATHDWLIAALGLDRYPIEHRDLDDRPKRGLHRR